MPDLLRFLTEFILSAAEGFETRDPKGYDIIVTFLLKHYTRSINLKICFRMERQK